MKVKLKPSDGFIVNVLMRILQFFGMPLDWLHEKLKKPFIRFSRKVINWSKTDLEGLYIELWVLFWALLNIFIILPNISKNATCILYAFIFILILRCADLCKAFLAFIYNLSKYPQRSLARSYIMLSLYFFEFAAISSSIQFIICKHFLIESKPATWQSVFYYSIRNMVTIGDGKIEPVCCNDHAYLLFGMVRILQPLFSVLLISLSVNQILNWRISRKTMKNRNKK
jgi:hypothetical protein